MIYAIDIETYEFDKENEVYKPILNARKFELGCAVDEKMKPRYFDSAEQMKAWIDERVEWAEKYKKRMYFYAHNMEYEWYGIFKDALISNDIKYICFHPFIAIYKNRGYFLDTMGLYRMSLASVGDVIGLAKKELPNNPSSMWEVRPYVERDCQIVMRAVLEVKQKLGELGYRPRKILTAGQLAMTSFLTFAKRNNLQYSFMDFDKESKQMKVVKTKYPEKVRFGFRGGRNEAFKNGYFKNVTSVDVNSLYPYIMTVMDFPDLRSEQYIDNPPVEYLDGLAVNKVGVVQCEINVPNIVLPYLPVYHKNEGKGMQLYPRDCTIRGTWTIKEIDRAMRLGYVVKKVYYVISYNKSGVNPLKDYILEMYKMRLSEDGKFKSVIKLLMNNLYGKFAQYRTTKDYKVIYRYEADKYSMLDGYKVISVTGNQYVVQYESGKYEPSYVNPIISTLITANARDYMYDLLGQVGFDDLLYTDTDSILFKGDYLNKFNINNRLGGMKVEVENRECKILGEKRYYIGDDVKISGMPSKSKSKDVIDNELDVPVQRMTSLKKAMVTGDFEAVGEFYTEVIEMRSHKKGDIEYEHLVDERKYYDDRFK